MGDGRLGQAGERRSRAEVAADRLRRGRAAGMGRGDGAGARRNARGLARTASAAPCKGPSLRRSPERRLPASAHSLGELPDSLSERHSAGLSSRRPQSRWCISAAANAGVGGGTKRGGVESGVRVPDEIDRRVVLICTGLCAIYGGESEESGSGGGQKDARSRLWARIAMQHRVGTDSAWCEASRRESIQHC